MAENPPKGPGHRGAVKERSEVKTPKTGRYVKRDRSTGRIRDQKADSKPLKGVRRER